MRHAPEGADIAPPRITWGDYTPTAKSGRAWTLSVMMRSSRPCCEACACRTRWMG